MISSPVLALMAGVKCYVPSSFILLYNILRWSLQLVKSKNIACHIPSLPRPSPFICFKKCIGHLCTNKLWLAALQSESTLHIDLLEPVHPA